jgi:hypothetical protein
MASENKYDNSSGNDSLWQWYRVWRYDILEPLIALSGFSEVLLKDANGVLDKPLTDNDKQRFLEIVLNKSKLIRHALDFFDLYIGYREFGSPNLIIWNGESSVNILEDVIEELRGEKKISKAILTGKDDIPLIRTSKDLLKSALTILLMYIYNPEQNEWEISVDFGKVNDSYVNMEINTNLYRSYWESLTIDQLFDDPPFHLMMSKVLIESIDGKFEAAFVDKKLVYQILLPIWWFPETVEKIVRTNLGDQRIELILGQELEVVRVLEENVEYDLSLVEIVECDRNVVANISRGMGQKGMYRLSFASVKPGSTDIKLRYSPPNISEPTIYTLRVTVKPQTPSIE